MTRYLVRALRQDAPWAHRSAATQRHLATEPRPPLGIPFDSCTATLASSSVPTESRRKDLCRLESPGMPARVANRHRRTSGLEPLRSLAADSQVARSSAA